MSVKLGQIAATRVDLVPPDIAAELALLQNQVRAEPTERMRPVIEAELGGPVERGVRRVRLGAAGRGLDRPDLPRPAAHAARRSWSRCSARTSRRSWSGTWPRSGWWPTWCSGARRSGRACGPGRCSTQFARSLRAELDFRREADAMSEMRALLGPDSAVRVPQVYGELCTRRLMVIEERFEGFTVADSARLAESGIDRQLLAERLLRSMLDQVLRIGFFHADPHPGNIFVLERRLARADRLRRRRPPRPHPATGGDRHHGRAGRSATSASSGRGSSRWPRWPRRWRPSASSGPSPD